MDSVDESGAGNPAPALQAPRRKIGRPSTLDRDAALLAARSVVARRGLASTRYADVAAAAGVPVTTLQHAFGSLQGMLLQSVQRSTASEIAVLRDLSRDTTLSPWGRLAEFIGGAVHPPDDPDSWLVWIELWSLAGRDARIGADAGVVYEQWWEYVAELITLGVDAGQFHGPLVADPHAAAQAAVGVIDGLAAALIMRADGPAPERTRELAESAIAAMLGYDGAR